MNHSYFNVEVEKLNISFAMDARIKDKAASLRPNIGLSGTISRQILACMNFANDFKNGYFAVTQSVFKRNNVQFFFFFFFRVSSGAITYETYKIRAKIIENSFCSVLLR